MNEKIVLLSDGSKVIGLRQVTEDVSNAIAVKGFKFYQNNDGTVSKGIAFVNEEGDKITI